MLYRIAGSDVPLLFQQLDELIQLNLSGRSRKAIYNRISQGLSRLMGLKGKVSSLSIILTQSTIEIGVEMTKESFNASATAGGDAKTLSISECNCSAMLLGHPHEPDCMWWHVRNLPKRPWKVVQHNEGVEGDVYRPVYIWDADNKQILYVGQADASLPLAKGIVAMANR